jgi:hypothetical protein
MICCLNITLNKTESYINQTLNKVPMYEIFVNLSCINGTPVCSEPKAGAKLKET